MVTKRTLSFDNQLAKQANYSPAFSDRNSPAGKKIYEKQKTEKGRKINVKRSENPNYLASKSFGQSDIPKLQKSPKLNKKSKNPPLKIRRKKV